MSTPKANSKANSRERILARLRAAAGESEPGAGPVVPSAFADGEPRNDAEWLARQPPIEDLAERFAAEQASTGGEVRRVRGWEGLPGAVAPWLAEREVTSVITGAEPRLEPLREALAADGRFTLHRYDRAPGGDPGEAQRKEVFSVDCGITTTWAGIAETGSAVIVPTPAEPRLLSLAVPLHLAVVEASTLLPRLTDFIASGRYQAEVPTNLVLVSGASRTADIEMTLALGVHGPKTLLVALIE